MSEKETTLIELINIFIPVVESNKGVATGADDRVIDSEGLALKYFSHVLSSLYVYRGINLNDLSIPIRDFLDPSSLNVLVRAAFETNLVFYHIFLDSKNNDEINLRYYCWVAAGLHQRQSFPSKIPKNIEKLKQEKVFLMQLEDKIKTNPIYLSYTVKQQEGILRRLEKGEWRDKGWTEIALSAGYSELNSRIIYSILCDRAHSGNISVMQVWQAKSFDDRKQLSEASMGHLIICTAFMIKQYCEYFKKSKEYFIKNYPEPNIVTLWVGVGSEKDNSSIFNI
ncbi:MAG: hypothetical protein KAW56_17105 [Candidatus Marinimicrobia bacterium]|nr:hypothetical protein [Candidatus Neomarinimicrobiota bacterium]